MAGLATALVGTGTALGLAALGVEPGFGALAAGTAIAGGIISGGELLYKGIKGDIDHYRAKKRQKMYIPSEDISGRTAGPHIMGDTQMGGVGHAGATNVVQRRFTKGTSGKRMRRNAKNAHRLLQASMSYCNLRWQRMFSYGNQIPINVIERPYPAAGMENNTSAVAPADQQGRLFLSSHTSGASPAIEHYMPGYLFDITTWRTDAGNQAEPMKRIYFNDTGNVRYDVVYSQNNDGTQIRDGGWQAELYYNFLPKRVQKSFLMWSDLRMSLYGARHCPTRFILELIQFKKDYFDPNIATSVTSEQQAEINAHYVSEFKKLTFHPLDVQLNKRNSNIKVLSRKVYEVAPDSNTNEDPTAPNVLVKIFKNYNRLCNWQWAVSNPGSSADTAQYVQPNIGNVDTVPTPDVTLTEMDQPDWIQNFSSNLRPYVNPKARIYLYIRAEAMHTYDEATLMNSDNALRHWPSFDICVRQRWMYEN